MRLSNPRKWMFVGAIGTEERSLSAWKWARELSDVEHTLMMEIRDMPSRFTALATDLLASRKDDFLHSGGKRDQILNEIELLTELHRIIAIAKDIERNECPSLILDITSLPKRFFFPLLRHLESSEHIHDLVVTYTSPEQYIVGEALSENFTDWATLPGFRGDGKSVMLAASVGFMVESMQSHIASITKHESVKLLIPFPAPVSILSRTWESVYKLQEGRARDKFQHFRIGGNDLPSAYERFVMLARESSAPLAFAPFGPKPLSAAMCLFASKHKCPVYYPQPRVYHPNYSSGVAQCDGNPSISAYWIKHDRQKLY